MSSGIQIVIIVALVIAAAAVISRTQEKRRREAFRNRLIQAFGKVPDKRMAEERYARVPAFFLRHLPEDAIDDITWNDLDMDAVFRRIDSTQSAPGEEYLYALLRSPVPGGNSARTIPIDEIRQLESEKNVPLRTNLQEALGRFGHLNRYSLYDYLDRLNEVKPENNAKHLPAFLLPAVSIIVLILNVPAGILCLLFSMVFNTASYYHFRGKADPYIATFGYLLRMMRCADELIDAGCSHVMPEEGRRLAEIQKNFASLRLLPCDAGRGQEAR